MFHGTLFTGVIDVTAIETAMRTDALVFLGFDSDAFDSTVLLGRLNNGITNDDIGIDIRESIRHSKK